jgi:hypothetical protein
MSRKNDLPAMLSKKAKEEASKQPTVEFELADEELDVVAGGICQTGGGSWAGLACDQEKASV